MEGRQECIFRAFASQSSFSLKVKKSKPGKKVLKIYKEQNTWKVQTEGWTYEGDAVILANGSKASKGSGSDGSGYVLAEELGHSVLRPLPALTGLKAKGNFFSSWAGCVRKVRRRYGSMERYLTAKPERASVDRVWYFWYSCVSDQRSGSKGTGSEKKRCLSH